MKRVEYVEFYSGIGGWGYAVSDAMCRIGEAAAPVRVAAYDHSDAANAVLWHNDGRRNPGADPDLLRDADGGGDDLGEVPGGRGRRGKRKKRKPGDPASVSIGRLSAEDLSSPWTDGGALPAPTRVWCMSPPCQPHTRQRASSGSGGGGGGGGTDDADARSDSFLHLCATLSSLRRKPDVVLLENVVGFEGSRCCDVWRLALAGAGYEAAHFHLDPTGSAGLPNERPRYYCAAVLCGGTPPVAEDAAITWERLRDVLDAEGDGTARALPPPRIHVRVPGGNRAAPPPPPVADFLDADLPGDAEKLAALCLPRKLLVGTAAWCLDVVLPSDARSACFTRSYGAFARGTGSVLYTGPVDDTVRSRIALVRPEEREFDAEAWRETGGLGDMEGHLRYFSGTEIARLMGFPVGGGDGFEFPRSCAIRKQWQLLGNSLNVRVAALVAEVGIERARYNRDVAEKLAPSS